MDNWIVSQHIMAISILLLLAALSIFGIFAGVWNAVIVVLVGLDIWVLLQLFGFYTQSSQLTAQIVYGVVWLGGLLVWVLLGLDMVIGLTIETIILFTIYILILFSPLAQIALISEDKFRLTDWVDFTKNKYVWRGVFWLLEKRGCMDTLKILMRSLIFQEFFQQQSFRSIFWERWGQLQISITQPVKQPLPKTMAVLFQAHFLENWLMYAVQNEFIKKEFFNLLNTNILILEHYIAVPNGKFDFWTLDFSKYAPSIDQSISKLENLVAANYPEDIREKMQHCLSLLYVTKGVLASLD